MTSRLELDATTTEALKRLRAERVPLYECAERIGVSYNVICRWAAELGLAQRFNRGRRPGRVVDAARHEAAVRRRV